MDSLRQLHSDIDARVRSIRERHPDWRCAKGCATCCRSLADLPRLAEAEWSLLREGLAALPPERLAAIRERLAALARQGAGPYICPLLDRTTGACPVYAQRPVACRSYGFYVQRDKGLYCGDIEQQVTAGALADVVWGNHDGIDRQLAGLGESRTLVEWFDRWRVG